VANQLNLIPPVVEQPQYNMFRRKRVEVELEPLTREYTLGLTTWSPLASGILTGKYNESIPEGSRASREDMAWLVDQLSQKRMAAVRQLTSLAQSLQITTAQLAIAWLLRRKEISSVITGATRMEQLDENLGAPEALEKMDDTVMEEIEQILENFPE
jgi:aryl-alcohol dehydrogenase-like predicted oxidoreductase